MTNKLVGSCLCGDIKFELNHDFVAFYQCHCHQCQKITGSAFASNLFTKPDNIKWLTGSDKLTRYVHPTREFSKSFCVTCGSAVPFLNKRKSSLIIPAGCLDNLENTEIKANIFVDEKACWLQDMSNTKCFSGFPSRG